MVRAKISPDYGGLKLIDGNLITFAYKCINPKMVYECHLQEMAYASEEEYEKAKGNQNVTALMYNARSIDIGTLADQAADYWVVSKLGPYFGCIYGRDLFLNPYYYNRTIWCAFSTKEVYVDSNYVTSLQMQLERVVAGRTQA